MRDVMLTDPVVVTPATTLADAQAIGTEHGHSWLPVVRGSRLLGLLEPADLGSDADVLRVVAGLQPTLDARSREPVERLARRPAAVLEPAHTLETAARLMLLKGCAVVPVVANGELAGMLTIDQLRRSIPGTTRVQPTEPGSPRVPSDNHPALRARSINEQRRRSKRKGDVR